MAVKYVYMVSMYGVVVARWNNETNGQYEPQTEKCVTSSPPPSSQQTMLIAQIVHTSET